MYTTANIVGSHYVINQRLDSVISIKRVAATLCRVAALKDPLSRYFSSSFGCCLQKFPQSLVDQDPDDLRTFRRIKNQNH